MSTFSRREFARRAAFASAASLLPAVASSGTLQPAAPSAETAPDAFSFPDEPPLSPQSQAEVDARIAAIFSQYGSRFSEEQKTDLRRLCRVAQPGLDHLRAYIVANGDAPALYLKPLVEREPRSATSPRPTAAAHPSPSKP
jgi:hypothetical protein